MDPRRKYIDPDGLYPAEGLRECEQRALEVLKYLPNAEVSRTRDVIQLSWGTERGVIVVVTAETLELRLPTVEWTRGAYGPAESSRMWKRRLWSRLGDDELPLLIGSALEARDREFKVCRYCGQEFPREHRFDARTCQGCASEHLGVVY